MKSERYESWGRFPKAEQNIRKLYWPDDPFPGDETAEKTLLPFGNGRSYGDVCLNHGGMLLDCRNLNRFIAFDSESGVLRCEAGVTLDEILKLTVPKGWFPPVTPGTRFVTVGGAIANDVHGKNHYRAGTFGCHVHCFELLRSDGTRRVCSVAENTELYRATIGGLGLTGVILWAEIQLRPVKTPYIDEEVIRFGCLDEFFQLARESEQSHEHTAAWVDCLAGGSSLGRGLFSRGNHADTLTGRRAKPPARQLTFPIDPPFPLVNGLTLKLFNNLYYRKQRSDQVTKQVHYVPCLYPLDAIAHWNRLYGSKGFFQYQCVIPTDQMEAAIREILERIAAARVGSFLAVLKLFGEKPSPGLLSFPMPGATLALDFANAGSKTRELLDRLDEVTRSAGGRVYPAKDARMSPENFQQAYPDWPALVDLVDPCISSSFWRRVMAKP